MEGDIRVWSVAGKSRPEPGVRDRQLLGIGKFPEQQRTKVLLNWLHLLAIANFNNLSVVTRVLTVAAQTKRDPELPLAES